LRLKILYQFSLKKQVIPTALKIYSPAQKIYCNRKIP
jgi:hypothetical protein